MICALASEAAVLAAAKCAVPLGGTHHDASRQLLQEVAVGRGHVLRGDVPTGSAGGLVCSVALLAIKRMLRSERVRSSISWVVASIRVVPEPVGSNGEHFDQRYSKENSNCAIGGS